eukprot:8476500-Pyramimonas_sp.AAC.1
MAGLVFNAMKSNQWYAAQYKKFMDNIVGLEKWGDVIHKRTMEIVQSNSMDVDPYVVLRELGEMKRDLDASVWRPYADSIENWLLHRFNFCDMRSTVSEVTSPAKQKELADIILDQLRLMKGFFPGRKAELEAHEATGLDLRDSFANGELLGQAVELLKQFTVQDPKIVLSQSQWDEVAKVVALVPQAFAKA